MSDIKAELLKRLEMVPELHDAFYAHLFDDYDKNQSGTLDIDESRELYKELCSRANDKFQYSEDLFITWFKEWDVNGDGSISREELKNLLMKRITDQLNEMIANLPA